MSTIVILKQGNAPQTSSSKEVARPYFKDTKERAERGEQLSDGENKAYWAWYYSNCQGEIVCDGLWEKEVHDFVGTMREAGVKSILYTDKSTALMGNLHAFVKEGCEISNLVRIEEEGEGLWTRHWEGIRIRL